MHKDRKTTPIDSKEETVTLIRDEERRSICIDIALSICFGKESIENIFKYTQIDAEEIQRTIALWREMAEYESKTKSRSMTCRILRSE